MLKGVWITLSTLIGVECCCAINYQDPFGFIRLGFFLVRVGLFHLNLVLG